jgi:hypothetical protein
LIDPEYHHYFARQFWLVGSGDLAKEICFLDEHHWTPTLAGQCEPPGPVDQLRAVSRPVLCACTNVWDIDAVRRWAQEIWGVQGYFLLHWDAGSVPDSNQGHWPYFYLEQRRALRPVLMPRRHRVSMLSGQVRRHRLDVWLAAKPWVQARDVVVINRFGADYSDVDPELLCQLPWSHPGGQVYPDQTVAAVHDTTAINHPAYLACANVTGESLGPGSGVFVTEKTWKAIQAGCQPLHTGCSGMTQYLTALGFHAWFPYTGSDAQRAMALFQASDLEQHWQRSRSQIQQDIDLFWSDDLVHGLTRPTVRALEKWLEHK